MKSQTVFSIGIDIPHNQVEFLSIQDNRSSLDADVIIIRPDITHFHGRYDETYAGKRLLGDQSSFDFRETLNHWRKELMEAMNAGKAIFVILSPLQEVYAYTGRKESSGKQTKQIVEKKSNYDLFPAEINVVSAHGKEVRRSDRAIEATDYFSEFKSRIQYSVYIESPVTKILFTSKDSTKTLGGMIKFKNVPGRMYLLPEIRFSDPDFTVGPYWESEWTPVALGVGQSFINRLLEMDRMVRGDTMCTIAPDWTKSNDYMLPRELEFRVKLNEISTKIDELQREKEETLKIAENESLLRDLLFEQGAPLEEAIIQALRLMGFSADRYKDSDSEFDAVFESGEGRFVGEAEGRDNKAIGISKMRQLAMNLHEDFDRENVTTMAKGILFGNAYRKVPLEERGDFFTEKCLSAAKVSSVALIKTPDLFEVVQYLSGNDDDSYRCECRKAIFSTDGGIVRFPPAQVSPSSEN